MDGSQIPILIVGRADARLDVSCPTLLSGYGGMQWSPVCSICMQP